MTIRNIMAALLAVALSTVAISSAQARSYQQPQIQYQPIYFDVNKGWYIKDDSTDTVKPRRHVRHHKKLVRARHAAKAKPVVVAKAVPSPRPDPRNQGAVWGEEHEQPKAIVERALGTLVAKHTEVAPRVGTAKNPNAGLISCPNGRYKGSTAIAGLHPVLKAKVQEITSACKSHVVSTYCRGGVTPNHGLGLAVDMKGNPDCIKKHLAGWPGGMSTDYFTAPGTQHYHFSYSRAHEWGYRFAHNGGGSRTKYASRRSGGGQQIEVAHSSYQNYAEDRNSGRQLVAMAVDDGSSRGKYKSMKHRRASIAMQRYAANVH